MQLDPETKKAFETIALETIRKYNKNSGFTDRKLTDLPTDALSVVNRKFVTMNGVTSGRPTGSVYGQFYLDSSLGYPIWYTDHWIKSDGTPA